MNKRILSLVLALVMVLGTFAVVSAEEAKVENMTQANKIQWLVDNKIVEGHKVNKDGEEANLDLDGNLTREQATKLLVYVIGKQDLAETLKGSLKLFKDVDLSRWSNGWINVAATHKESVKGETIVKGYPDGTFGPERNVTYAELATMLVRIVKNDMLGKDEINFAGANWATQYMRWAAEEGILDGLKIADSNAPASRRDAFEMIFNAKYRYKGTNNVDFGDKMGIISKLAAGKVEINQDSKMTYNITYNTVFTDGTTINSLAENAARPGSLVRLITDKDNNVLYMIELGNPRVGAIYKRWDTVADYTVSAMDSNMGTARFVGDSAIEFTNGNIKTDVKLMSNTKYFVADVERNFLKEVKSVTEAMNYVGFDGRIWTNKEIKNVYAGYDKTAWGSEARVVVFNTTHKYNANYNLLRVVTPGVNSRHNVELQNTKGDRVSANAGNWFPTNWFPGNWTFDYMDVVSFRTVKETNNVYTKPVVEIDYSTFPVYEVVKIDRAYRSITLRDEFNRKQDFVLDPDFDEFLNGQTLKNSHVQVAFNSDGYISVISNVDLGLRGALKNGVNPDLTKKVKLERVYSDQGSYYVVVKDVLDKGVYGQARTYKLTSDDYEALKGILAEAKDVILEITLSTNDNGYQTPVVVEYEVKPFEIIPAEADDMVKQLVIRQTSNSWSITLIFEEININTLDSLTIALYDGDRMIAEQKATEKTLTDLEQPDLSSPFYKDGTKDLDYWTITKDLLAGTPDKVVITFELDGETYTVESTDSEL